MCSVCVSGWAQTELRNFASIYRKQYSLAYLSHVHDELVQRKQEHTQLLKQHVRTAWLDGSYVMEA